MPKEIVTEIPNNWRPRDDQRPLWDYLEQHIHKGRAVEVAHRRWGKDDVALNFTAASAHERIGNYWHMLPMYAQARKAIWDAINPKTGKKRIDEAFPQALRKKTNSQEMKIEFNCGSIWQLVGSDNYDSLVGSPPIGVVFSEYALANPLAWGYIRPILAENGGWALFIYTSRGNNHGKKLYDFANVESGWFAEKRTVEQSPVFSKEILEQERKEMKAELGEDEGEALFQQEYYCSFEGAVIGSYYAKQIAKARTEGRITSVPYEPKVPVDTFWDLGMNDTMAIWFIQFVGKERRVIDYYEFNNEGLLHYAKVLKDKGYLYGDHYMPHDVEVRELGTGVSRKDTAESMGIKPIITVERAKDIQAVNNGIESVRNILPSCWFDEKKCQKGLSALEGYRKEYDEVKKVFHNRPYHDWCSNGSDAFRTFAVGYKEKIASAKPSPAVSHGLAM